MLGVVKDGAIKVKVPWIWSAPSYRNAEVPTYAGDTAGEAYQRGTEGLLRHCEDGCVVWETSMFLSVSEQLHASFIYLV